MVNRYGFLAAVLIGLFLAASCDDDDDSGADAGATDGDADADADTDSGGAGGFGLDALDYADDRPEFAACVVKNCQGVDAASFYAMEQCALQKCRAEYETDFTFGDGQCKRILFCVERCILDGRMSDQCQRDCLAGSTYEYALEFLEVGICVQDNCQPETFADPLNHLPCFLNTCKALIDPCCGGTVQMCM